MRTLLITGANGWLGKAIINVFIESSDFLQEVDFLLLHSLDQKSYLDQSSINIISQKGIQHKYVVGSLDDKNLSLKIVNELARQEVSKLSVIYTSSIIHATNISDFRRINFLGLVDFFNSLDDTVLSKFTYISSNSPFGFNKQSSVFDETSNYNPIGEYGYSKKLAEQFLFNFKDQKKITILRAPWFHGLYMPNRQKNFLQKASKGTFPIIGLGNNKRSIVNTSDLAQAALNVTFYERNSNVYWISDKYSYSMKSMLKIIKDSYAKKMNINPNKKISYLLLPKGFSSLFCIIDLLLQKIGIYNMYIHVLGELGQNIECSSERYRNEFKNHKWKDFKDSIMDELNEAWSKN